MKPFKAIAAMSLNRVIGAGNKIPWHLPEDFKWFKQMTTGHVIVMGRKTFESIGKPLPNRETIVLTRSAFVHPGVKVVHRLEELIQETANAAGSGTGVPPVRIETHGRDARATTEVPAPHPREIFICGGAQIYEHALPFCSDLYLTLVKREVAGDAFFPPFEDQFELVEELRDGPDFKILHYRRRTTNDRSE